LKVVWIGAYRSKIILGAILVMPFSEDRSAVSIDTSRKHNLKCLQRLLAKKYRRDESNKETRQPSPSLFNKNSE
jgi:hypothetical protein